MPRSPHRTGSAYQRARRQALARSSICWICGNPINPALKWPDPMSATVDHIDPVALNPDQPVTPDGLKPAHFRCNIQRGKGDRITKPPQSEQW